MAEVKNIELVNGVTVTAPNDLGGSTGGGAGEINYVLNPNATLDLSGWVDSGVGLTSSRTEVAAELPREPVSSTAIKIQNEGSGTDYVRYRLTMGDADKNKKLKIQWAQKVGSAYTNDDYHVEMYTNTASDYSGTYVELPLTGDVSGDSFIKATDGVFLDTFSSDDSDFYELRFVRAAGGSTVNDFIAIGDVTVGPGAVSTGAIIEPWAPYAPTSFTGLGTLSGVNLETRRVGESMQIRGYFTSGTASASVVEIDLPDGYTVGGVSGDTALVGKYALDEASVTNMGTLIATNGDAFIELAEQDVRDASNTNPLVGRSGSSAIGSTKRFSLIASVPIAEWIDTGTITLGQTPSIITPWVSYTPTNTQGFGTITADNLEYRRVGDSVDIRGYFTAGTVTGSEAQLELPAGLSIGGDGSDTNFVGIASQDATNGGAHFANVLATKSDTFINFGRNRNGTADNPTEPSTGTEVAVTTTRFVVQAAGIPITEWAGGSQDTATIGISQATNDELGLVRVERGTWSGTITDINMGTVDATIDGTYTKIDNKVFCIADNNIAYSGLDAASNTRTVLDIDTSGLPVPASGFDFSGIASIHTSNGNKSAMVATTDSVDHVVFEWVALTGVFGTGAGTVRHLSFSYTVD